MITSGREVGMMFPIKVTIYCEGATRSYMVSVWEAEKCYTYLRGRYLWLGVYCREIDKW